MRRLAGKQPRRATLVSSSVRTISRPSLALPLEAALRDLERDLNEYANEYTALSTTEVRQVEVQEQTEQVEALQGSRDTSTGTGTDTAKDPNGSKLEEMQTGSAFRISNSALGAAAPEHSLRVSGAEDAFLSTRDSQFRVAMFRPEQRGTSLIELFTKLVWFSQTHKWVDPLNMALILVCLLATLGAFCLLTLNQADTEENVGFFTPLWARILCVILAVLSGLRPFAILILGLPLLRQTEITMTILIDNLVWIFSVAITSYSVFHVHENDPVDEGRIALVGFNSLVFAIRLNSHIVHNAAVSSLMIHRRPRHHHQSNKEESSLLIPVDEVCTRIQQANGISTKYKTILLGMTEFADTDHDGHLTQGEFLMLSRDIDTLFLRAFMAGDKSNANGKELRAQLQYQKMAPVCGVSVHQVEGGLPYDPDDDEDDEGGTIFSTMVVAIRQLFQAQQFLSWAAMFMLFVSAMITPLFDFLVGVMVNWAIEIANEQMDNQHNFMLGLWGVFVIFLADEVVFYILSAMVAKMIAHASKRIQSEIVHGVLDGDASFERKHRPASLANVFTAGIAKLENVWDFCLMEAVFSFFSLISALFFLSLYNFGYTIFVLTAIPFLASLKPMETQAVTASDQSDQANAELFGRFQNTIHLRRAAQVGNRRDFVANRFHNPLLEEAAGHNFWSWLWSYVVVAVYSTVGSALYMVTTIIFLLLLSKGEIDSGEFFAVTSFVYGVLEPIEALGRVSGQVVQNAGAVRQVQRILDDARKSGREDTGNKAKNANPQTEQALTLKKQLEFDNVKFSYTPNGPLILKGVSFSIPAGSYVAVLGSSGSGKSTLLSLLMGIQTAQEGSIRMDGTAISTVSLDTLRDSLAVVFQETFVLDGTVFDNISFGCNATMEQVVHAAKQASVHEVIEKLPEKYDTILGKESAISMSGGQLQRICGIARAVVQGKALLLLDEATSALDAITEHKFIETVEQLRDEGLTVISITHHPSTARNADMILVLDKGIVVETGAYSELIDGGGLFSRLASAS